MERFYCKCLNIIINVNSKYTKEVEGQSFIEIGLGGISQKNVESFFKGKLLDVRLGVSGIELSLPALSKERSIGDWLVVSCLNCGLDTHATHATKGADRVLLSADIPHGDHILKAIQGSAFYSTFLKLELVDEGTSMENSGSTYFNQSNVAEFLDKLHLACKKLITAEEDAKNERVRVFTENENQHFSDYKVKAHLDEKSLSRRMHRFEDSNSVFANYYSSVVSESRDQSTALPIFKAPILFITPAETVNESPSEGFSRSLPVHDNKTLSENIANFHNQDTVKNKMDKRKFSDNDDILFDMEGYQCEKSCEPFFESGDESSGDAISLESNDGFSATSREVTMGGSCHHDNLVPMERVHASSLPVPVPLFNNMRHSYEPESDDENASPSFTRLAVSFKAVTKSMQDSTGMFGDLPPRRKEHSNEVLSVCDEGLA